MLFINNVKRKVRMKRARFNQENNNQSMHDNSIVPALFVTNRYIVTVGKAYEVNNKTIKCKPGLVIDLSESDIREALDYFFRKATLEIKQFLSANMYQKISEEVNGILYYKGRIMPTQKVGGRESMSDVILDLSGDTFHAPLTDSCSPVAYSIVNEVHWYDENAMHSGVETVLRYTQKFAHIIEGRELVRKFKIVW